MAAGNARNDVYDPVTIFLHWTTAILVAIQFFLVLSPVTIRGSTPLHETIGLLILAIVPVRILWRLTLGRRSSAGDGEPLLLRLGAKAAHGAVYALLIVIPLLGWAYSDALSNDTYFFNIELPMMVYYDRALAARIYWWKQVCAYGLLLLLFAHAGAAIAYHHIMRRDGVLRSMLPRRCRDRMFSN
jgi:cytochrome b561